MENIFEFLKAHFEWVLIGFGVLEIVGSILRWGWILEPSGKMKNSFICSAIMDKWGENGLRGINIFLGTLIVICGVIFLLLDK